MARGGNGPRPRRDPQRTCVACRQGNAKRDLVRVVRLVDGAVQIDPTGKKSGRGAYLHQARECWDEALKRNVLTHALKVERIPPEDMTALAAYGERLAPAPSAAEPAPAAT